MFIESWIMNSPWLKYLFTRIRVFFFPMLLAKSIKLMTAICNRRQDKGKQGDGTTGLSGSIWGPQLNLLLHHQQFGDWLLSRISGDFSNCGWKFSREKFCLPEDHTTWFLLASFSLHCGLVRSHSQRIFPTSPGLVLGQHSFLNRCTGIHHGPRWFGRYI